MKNFCCIPDIYFRVKFTRETGFSKNNEHPEEKQEMIFKKWFQYLFIALIGSNFIVKLIAGY